MSTSSAVLAVAQALAVVNTLIQLSGNEKRFRELVANAVASGRTLNAEELEMLADEARSAADRLKTRLQTP